MQVSVSSLNFVQNTGKEKSVCIHLALCMNRYETNCITINSNLTESIVILIYYRLECGCFNVFFFISGVVGSLTAWKTEVLSRVQISAQKIYSLCTIHLGNSIDPSLIHCTNDG